MAENNLLSIIIFAPLAGAIINWLIGGRLRNEAFSGLVACGTIAISTIVAFMIAFGIGTPHPGALFVPEGRPILDHLSYDRSSGKPGRATAGDTPFRTRPRNRSMRPLHGGRPAACAQHRSKDRF